MTRYLKPLFIAGICYLLMSCGSTQIQQSGISTDNLIPLEHIDKAITKAREADEPDRSNQLLKITRSLVKLNETDWARSILEEVDILDLNSPQYFSYSVIAAQLAELDGEIFIAKSYLWDERVITNYENAIEQERILFRDLRATLLFNLAEYQQSVWERLLNTRENSLDNAQEQLNQELIWLSLMELTAKELEVESENQNDYIAKGWYTLAALSKDNQTNLRRQLHAVDEWMLFWPEHPASLNLPADLQLLRQLAEHQPKQVALLLPGNGQLKNAARAIRDGFMAAYYDSSTQSSDNPEVRFYDTSSGDVNEVYDLAVSEGAEIIIGPLNKSNIELLVTRESLAVPTLALNYVEIQPSEDYEIYQFGLAIEDEAKQVALQAWRDGHRNAMILAPESAWGDRAVETFISMWQNLGAESAVDYRFKDQKTYSNLIKRAVHITGSEYRHKKLRQTIDRTAEFEPRRRRDMDFIFLVGHASQARQLKPALNFHYASDLPVYATSHVYDGKLNAKLDSDLNNIRFTTLPWFFDQELAEKQSIDRHTRSAPSYQRLYALGVDAFHLYPRLKQLDRVKQSQFYGSTGTLSINQKRIVRSQTWALFVRGRATETPTISENEDI